MNKYLVAMIFGVAWANQSLAADVTIGHPEETQEEIRQLFDHGAAYCAGQLAEFAYLDRVITDHPANRPARLDRARLLIDMGRPDEASKDLDEIARTSPDFLSLSGTRIDCYRVKGDRTKELQEMKDLAGKTFTDRTAKDFAQSSIRENRPRMAELAGNMVLAKKEWQAWVDEGPPQERGSRLTDQADFYLRQGDCRDAVARARAAVDLQRGQVDDDSYPASVMDSLGITRSLTPNARHDDFSLANALEWYGFSLWADGQRAEALAAFLDATQQPIDESLYSLRTFDRANRSLAILSARVLAINGTEKDKTTAVSLLSDLAKSASGKTPYSLEPIVVALADGSALKPVADTVARVLKQAPNLDWALWGATYLALLDPEDCRDLAELVPEDTVQGRILRSERAYSSVHPKR